MNTDDLSILAGVVIFLATLFSCLLLLRASWNKLNGSLRDYESEIRHDEQNGRSVERMNEWQ